MSTRNFALIASLTACGLLYAAPAAATNTSSLTQNEMLIPGQSIVSPACAYHLDMQADGNLVLYRSAGAGSPVWASNTVGSPDAAAIMQSDGNFVVYATNDWPSLYAVWSTGTSGGTSVTVQDDGNLVVYDGSKALWASNTAGEVIGQTCEEQSRITHMEYAYRPNGTVSSVTTHVTMTECAVQTQTCAAGMYDGNPMGDADCYCLSDVTSWLGSTGYVSFWVGSD